MSVLLVYDLVFVDCDSVSEVFSLTNVEAVTCIMFLDRQFMSDLIFHVFSFLNVMDSSVIMRLHVPHLGSLHLAAIVAFEGTVKISLLLNAVSSFLVALDLLSFY